MLQAIIEKRLRGKREKGREKSKTNRLFHLNNVSGCHSTAQYKAHKDTSKTKREYVCHEMHTGAEVAHSNISKRAEQGSGHSAENTDDPVWSEREEETKARAGNKDDACEADASGDGIDTSDRFCKHEVGEQHGNDWAYEKDANSFTDREEVERVEERGHCHGAYDASKGKEFPLARS